MQYLCEKLQNKAITETAIEVVSIAGMSQLIKKLSGQHCRNDTLKEGHDIKLIGGQYHRNIIKEEVVNIIGIRWSVSPEWVVNMNRNIHS